MYIQNIERLHAVQSGISVGFRSCLMLLFLLYHIFMCNAQQSTFSAFSHSINKLWSTDQSPISLIIEIRLNETISSDSNWKIASESIQVWRSVSIVSFSVLTLNDLNTTTATTRTTTSGVNHPFFYFLLNAQLNCWAAIQVHMHQMPGHFTSHAVHCSLFTNNIKFPFVSLMMWR